MNWFQKLERKYSKYAIPNLMQYIIILYAIGFLIDLMFPQVYQYYLALNAEAILHGQLWRIVTFIIQPPSSTNLFFIVFVLYFYYMIGMVLEQIWGAFRFNLYFFTGVLLHVIAAILIYLVTGQNLSMSTYYLNLALFMAFAIEQPEMQVMLFFVIPVKMKWLAWIDAALFAVTIIGGYCVQWIPLSMYIGLLKSGIVLTPTLATAALISMMNFLLFVVIYKKSPLKTSTQRNFNKAYKTAKKAQKKRMSNQTSTFGTDSSKSNDGNGTRTTQRGRATGTKHCCAVCGRTELDGDHLIFRYCSKCTGSYEYCQEHLYTHIHVSKK